MSTPPTFPFVELQTPQGLQPHPVTNIFAIGRNYAAHAKELGNVVPSEPVVFMKPTTSLVHEPNPLHIPKSCDCLHYEAELVLLIGDNIPQVMTKQNALTAVLAYGLGLDLTDRDKQTQLKTQGLPWTLAKGFKGSAPISQFILANAVDNIHQLAYKLTVNGEQKQEADLSLMLFDLPTLLCFLNDYIGIHAGDLIFTGTPPGVGPIANGDTLQLAFNHFPLQATFTVSDL